MNKYQAEMGIQGFVFEAKSLGNAIDFFKDEVKRNSPLSLARLYKMPRTLNDTAQIFYENFQFQYHIHDNN